MEVEGTELRACNSTSREEILKEANGSFDDGPHTQSISKPSVIEKMAYLLTTDEDDILTPVYA